MTTLWLQIVTALYTIGAVTWMVLRIRKSMGVSRETADTMAEVRDKLVQVIEMDSRVKALEEAVFGWRN